MTLWERIKLTAWVGLTAGFAYYMGYLMGGGGCK